MTDLRPGSARLSVSASKLKDFARCERAWYLSAVARAPDDDTAGGKYLVQGDLFDEAVQRYSARMGVDVEDLVSAVRAKPGLRGAALSLADYDWVVLAERAQRMLRAVQHLLPTPKTARIQHRFRVLVPGYEDRGGVVVTGVTDLRVPGVVWDTKSTSDRGPGRGCDAKTPPRAFTAETLRDDCQARLYAWCEFMVDPDRLSVQCIWVYSSKPSTGAPAAWAVEAIFTRADTLAWFDSWARPRIDRMLVLEEGSDFELAPNTAAANHDSCGRCFRRLACSAFSGAQHDHSTQPGAIVMALDIKALRARQSSASPGPSLAPLAVVTEPSLEDTLRASIEFTTPAGGARESVYSALVADAAAVAGGTQDDRRADVVAAQLVEDFAETIKAAGVLYGSVGAVAINRPDAPPNPHAAPAPAALLPVLDVPGAPADAEAGVVADPTPAAVPEPRKGRGRPRKAPSVAGAGQAPSPTSDTGAASPSAAGSAPRARAAAAPGDLAERVEALATLAQTIVDQCNTLLRDLGVTL